MAFTMPQANNRPVRFRGAKTPRKPSVKRKAKKLATRGLISETAMKKYVGG